MFLSNLFSVKRIASRFFFGFALIAFGALLPPSLFAKPVKIGFITTLTTPAGYLGRDGRDGFMMAVKDGTLNGIDVEVLVENDQFKPAVGKKIADKLLKKERVKIFTGIIFSNISAAVVPAVLNKKAFYVSSNAAPSMFAGKKCHQNYFASAWQNDNLHESAGAVANNLGYNKVAMIAPNYPAGRDAITGFSREFKGEKVATYYTQLGQSDYAVEISKVKNSGADALFIFLPGGMGIKFLKQYAQSGVNKNIPVVTSSINTDVQILKAVGDSMLGVNSSSHWSQTLNDASKEFTAAFEKKYGRTPTVYAAQGYDAALLIGSALKASKGKIQANSKSFRAGLKKADFASLRGDFKFGNNNHPIENWYARVVEKDKDGKLYNKVLGTVLTAHQDAYAGSCKLK